MVASREDGAALARDAESAGCEVLIALQTMAVPPAFAGAALDALPRLPVVVWTAHRHRRVEPAFSHGDITTEGATVGAPMLTNVLVRRGRPFVLVAGRIDDSEAQARVAAAARAGAVATRLRQARIGRVGMPIDGYDCVDVDPRRLQATLGIELVAIDPGEVRDRYLAVAPERVEELQRETRSIYAIEASAEGETLLRSLRAACAIEDIVRDHRLDAGAMNCHVPEIRLGTEVGIAPCFGLGRSTSAGVPWSCAGDVVTAVAMLTTKLLGGAALYHELESLDYESGELVVANSGEHDLAFCDPAERPTLRPNDWFVSRSRRRGMRVLRRAGGPGEPRRVHRARRAGAGLSLHRGRGRVHDDALARDRHAARRVPVPARAGARRLGALGACRREPPLVRNTGRARRGRRAGRVVPRRRVGAGLDDGLVAGDAEPEQQRDVDREEREHRAHGGELRSRCVVVDERELDHARDDQIADERPSGDEEERLPGEARDAREQHDRGEQQDAGSHEQDRRQRHRRVVRDVSGDQDRGDDRQHEGSDRERRDGWETVAHPAAR